MRGKPDFPVRISAACDPHKAGICPASAYICFRIALCSGLCYIRPEEESQL